MPLHVEQVAGYIKDFAQLNFPFALGNLYLEHDAEIQLVPPQPDSYFLGEPDRYRPFACPALFVNPARTKRPQNHTFNSVLYQEHAIELVLLVEDVGEDTLTRACLRYAQALDALLNEFTLEPGVITDYSCLCHVTDIDYGVTYTKTQLDMRVFRRDVTLGVLVQHWDQFTQVPLQTGSGAQITSVTGQPCPGGIFPGFRWEPVPLVGSMDGVNVTFTKSITFQLDPASGVPKALIRWRDQPLTYVPSAPTSGQWTLSGNDVVVGEAPQDGDDLAIWFCVTVG